jgi:ABC-type protease/lipase transport system fused ATPase/permease subunit
MPNKEPEAPVAAALAEARRRIMGIAGLSGAINLLTLSGPVYMLQVYDRVLPSRNVSTLLALSTLVLAAYALQGCLDAIRSRMLTRISALLDASLQEPIYAALMRLSLKGAAPVTAQQPLRDLELVRAFLSGMGPTAFLDMPWLPIFLLVLFLFHPLIGSVAVIGAGLIVSTTLLAERQSRMFAGGIAKCSVERAGLADEIRHNAEVIHVLGMNGRFRSAWCRLNDAHIEQGIPMRDVEADIGAAAKTLRYALQSAVLGAGTDRDRARHLETAPVRTWCRSASARGLGQRRAGVGAEAEVAQVSQQPLSRARGCGAAWFRPGGNQRGLVRAGRRRWACIARCKRLREDVSG